jgi:hypothetical protein
LHSDEVLGRQDRPRLGVGGEGRRGSSWVDCDVEEV